MAINIHTNSQLVVAFFNELHSLKINYCHWKSNEALERTINSKNDIDILVDKKDSDQLNIVLGKLRFKQVIYPARSQHLPGIHSFYGYDEHLERFIHLHLHYHLLFGPGTNKTFRIPVEKNFLNHAIIEDQFSIKIAKPEFELIFLVLRFIVKYSLFQNILLRRKMYSDHVIRELTFLEGRTSQENLKHIFKSNFPFLEWSLFMRCFQALKRGRFDIINRIQLRRQVFLSLSAYSTMPLWRVHFLRRLNLLGRLLNGKLKLRNTKAKIVSSGKFIAIVGGDGAGKTTLIKSVTKWLSKRFQVHYIHMGKPLPSILMRGFKLISKFNTLKKLILRKIGIATKDKDYFWLIYQVLVARDRYLLYKYALRITSKGGIIISDRFPLHFLKMMDSPKCEQQPHLRNEKLVQWLIKKEKSYYRFFIIPDVLLALRVAPDIAVARKTDEEATYVRRRSTEFYNADWNRPNMFLINASEPKERVSRKAKRIIWENF